MMLKRVENNEMVSYEYHALDELESILTKWKDEFRLRNRTDEVIKMFGKDAAYDRYCEEIGQILKSAQEFMNDKCSKCEIKDHEGKGFCRCEMRNIQRAKYLREIHKNS